MMDSRLRTGWLLPWLTGALALSLAWAETAGAQARTHRWQRTQREVPLSNLEDVLETRWSLKRGEGAHDRIQLHRYRNKGPAKAVLLYLPGTNMNGTVAVADENHNLWLFLARRGVHVYALDYRTHFVPNDELEDASFTGVGISFGGGMCNVCIAYLGMPALSFCTAQAGDYIDTSTASVTSETTANVRLYKESGFSINGLSQKSIDQALSVYYCDMIRGIAEGLEREAKNTKKLPRFDQAIPVAVSGGSALAGGFQQELEKALGNISLPFEISQVKLAEDPFTSTAKGTLMAATLEM